MRRELVDALANDDLIRVREMNRAFRGPRILFGYYQAGLVVTLLVERHGFPSMVRLLSAFDRGLDLDAALAEVYRTTPEDLDRDFEAWARAHVAGLFVEPRWAPEHLRRAAVGLARRPPQDEAARPAWQERWITQAFGAWQQGRRVDAQEALRVAREAGTGNPRALLLSAEMALGAGERERAEELYRAALDGGREDYRARLALATFARERGDLDAAQRDLEAAERAFPGWDDPELSAELALADLHAHADREDESMAARERWLAWNAGDVTRRLAVAAWHVEHGRLERALALYAQANEVDPFLRALHRAWGDALRAAGRHAEALREYRMTLAVPAELDADDPGEWGSAARAAVIALVAACHEALGEKAEALARAQEALALDPGAALAREVVDRLQ
jgi:tetratricopeptide (TPR) repeat protein